MDKHLQNLLAALEAGSLGSSEKMDHTTSFPPKTTKPISIDGTHPWTPEEVKVALGFDADDPNVSVKFYGGDPSDAEVQSLLAAVGRSGVTAAVTAEPEPEPEAFVEGPLTPAQAMEALGEILYALPGDGSVLRTLTEVVMEVVTAVNKFDAFNSAHEGYAVIKEEVDELWDEVKADNGYTGAARTEAKQIAAMGIRYMLDIANGEHD